MSDGIAYERGFADGRTTCRHIEQERDELREKWEPNRTGKYPADHPLIRLQEVAVERDEAQALVRREFPSELIEAAREALFFVLNDPDFLASQASLAHYQAFEALDALLPTHPKENP